MPPKRSNPVNSVIRNHPLKTKATIAGIIAGLISGCAGFPVASTLRLVCGTATGIVDIVEKVNRQGADAATRGADAAL